VDGDAAIGGEDVGREGDRAQQDEAVTGGTEVGARAGEQEQADGRRPRRHPRDPPGALTEHGRSEQRREDDEEPRDEAGVRCGRVLEAQGLEQVARRQERAHDEPGPPPGGRQAPQAASRHEADEQRGGDEAVGQERRDRQALDGVLHHHERQPPDGGDPDERELGQAGAGHACRDGHMRRSAHSRQAGRGAWHVRRP
jgi:hypothetical protein